MSDKIKIRCTFVIEVDASQIPKEERAFYFEDNHCPGTGLVGAALEEHMKLCDEESVCWACSLGGTCEIIADGTVTRGGGG